MSSAPCPAIRARSRRVARRAPPVLHLGIAVQPLVVVVPEAPRIEIDDLLQPRQPRRDLQHLVDLLLVARHDEPRPAVLQHVGHLLGHRVLVERHRHRAADLRRHHRPVEPRPVAADDRQIVPRPQPKLGQPRRQRQHLGLGLGPGPALPDAVLLLAIGGTAAERRRVPAQELGERVEFPGGSRLAHDRPSPCRRRSGAPFASKQYQQRDFGPENFRQATSVPCAASQAATLARAASATRAADHPGLKSELPSPKPSIPAARHSAKSAGPTPPTA